MIYAVELRNREKKVEQTANSQQHGWILRVLCQLVRERQILYDLICVWNLKKNEQRTDWCLPEADEMSKGGQRNKQCKINPGDIMYTVVIIENK